MMVSKSERERLNLAVNKLMDNYEEILASEISSLESEEINEIKKCYSKLPNNMTKYISYRDFENLFYQNAKWTLTVRAVYRNAFIKKIIKKINKNMASQDIKIAKEQRKLKRKLKKKSSD